MGSAYVDAIRTSLPACDDCSENIVLRHGEAAIHKFF